MGVYEEELLANRRELSRAKSAEEVKTTYIKITTLLTEAKEEQRARI